MKRPEYVAAAVSACRLAAGGEAVPQELAQDLEAVFSRSGFTQGYLTGALGRGMFGTRRKEDVTAATEQVFSKLRGLYRRELPRVPVDLTLEEQGGEGVLIATDREGRQARAAAPLGDPGLLPCPGALPPAAGKDGGTPFYPGRSPCRKRGCAWGWGPSTACAARFWRTCWSSAPGGRPFPWRGSFPLPGPGRGLPGTGCLRGPASARSLKCRSRPRPAGSCAALGDQPGTLWTG